MNKKFLLLFSSHIDNDEKMNFSIDTLKKLREEGIPICFCTHSNKYLNVLSEYCDFLFYEKDNQFVKSSDYLNNIELLDIKNCSYGNSDIYVDIGCAKTVSHIPGSAHSKPALALIRGGLGISNLNGYEWTIYFEYDIPLPLNGLKKTIEEKINLLEKEKKDCFYFLHDKMGHDMLWGGFVLFKTQKIIKSKLLFKEPWFENTTEWIKTWGNCFFEFCLINSIYDAVSDNIITKKISEECYDLWGISPNSYETLSRSWETDISKRNPIVSHLYPRLDNGAYKVYLFIYSSKPTTVFDLEIYLDGNLIYRIDEKVFEPRNWFFEEIHFKPTNKKLEYKYSVLYADEIFKENETYDLTNLEKIYNFLLKIIFK